MTLSIDIRRRRALWRACHRGTRELDLLIGRFAEERVGAMDCVALERFEAFLALKDPELQAWLLAPVMGSQVMGAQAGEFADLVAEVRRFHGLQT